MLPDLSHLRRKSASLHWRFLAPLVITVICVAGLLGCGGSSDPSPSATPEDGAVPAPHIVGEPSDQFSDSGTQAKIVHFGNESSPAERRAASEVLKENLAARQNANFSSQCASLGKKGLESIVGSNKPSAAAECPQALKKLATPLPQSMGTRTDVFGGSIAALRVEDGHGYALFHGTNGKDYAMRMEIENGQWKVSEVLLTVLTKPNEG